MARAMMVLVIGLMVGPATALTGDINLDGQVNFDDFFILADNFGKKGVQAPDPDIVFATTATGRQVALQNSGSWAYVPTPEQVTVIPPTGTPHTMILVTAGSFIMGSDTGDDNARPAHTPALDAFYIDKLEVTNYQFSEFASAFGDQDGDGQSLYDSVPVEIFDVAKTASMPATYVTWYGAKAYCEWAGLRLPTEAEWEKAARGVDGRNYPWGEGIDKTRANYDNDPGGPTRVGSFATGASPYGVLDMAGSAAEWVSDWYDPTYYAHGPLTNPTGPESGQTKVLKGGAWAYQALELRSWLRGEAGPGGGWEAWGFRCAKSAE